MRLKRKTKRTLLLVGVLTSPILSAGFLTLIIQLMK